MSSSASFWSAAFFFFSALWYMSQSRGHLMTAWQIFSVFYNFSIVTSLDFITLSKSCTFAMRGSTTVSYYCFSLSYVLSSFMRVRSSSLCNILSYFLYFASSRLNWFLSFKYRSMTSDVTSLSSITDTYQFTTFTLFSSTQILSFYFWFSSLVLFISRSKNSLSIKRACAIALLSSNTAS